MLKTKKTGITEALVMYSGKNQMGHIAIKYASIPLKPNTISPSFARFLAVASFNLLLVSSINFSSLKFKNSRLLWNALIAYCTFSKLFK